MILPVAIAELRRAAATSGGRLMRHLLALEARRDARASRRELYRLDDRALADIGLTHPDFAERPKSSC